MVSPFAILQGNIMIPKISPTLQIKCDSKLLTSQLDKAEYLNQRVTLRVPVDMLITGKQQLAQITSLQEVVANIRVELSEKLHIAAEEFLVDCRWEDGAWSYFAISQEQINPYLGVMQQSGAITVGIFPENNNNFNLLPWRTTISGYHRRLVNSLTAMLLLIVAGVLITYATSLKLKEDILQRNLESLQQVQLSVIETKHVENTPKQPVESREEVLQKLVTIANSTGYTITLIELNYNGLQKIEVVGYATSVQELNRFIERLQLSIHFSSVAVKQTQQLETPVGNKRLSFNMDIKS